MQHFNDTPVKTCHKRRQTLNNSCKKIDSINSQKHWGKFVGGMVGTNFPTTSSDESWRSSDPTHHPPNRLHLALSLFTTIRWYVKISYFHGWLLQKICKSRKDWWTFLSLCTNSLSVQKLNCWFVSWGRKHSEGNHWDAHKVLKFTTYKYKYKYIYKYKYEYKYKYKNVRQILDFQRESCGTMQWMNTEHHWIGHWW